VTNERNTRTPQSAVPDMELTDALVTARETRESVLTTIRRNGRPQLSNVLHAVGEDGLIRISTTADRAKFKNLQREPWAALHVNGKNHWSYAVIEGEVTLSDVASDPSDAAVEELVELYRSTAGEHEDWDDYRAAMVAERRAVVRISPTRAYGILPRR
jgi:PPOX class probable F420-dependent enzyme